MDLFTQESLSEKDLLCIDGIEILSTGEEYEFDDEQVVYEDLVKLSQIFPQVFFSSIDYLFRDFEEIAPKVHLFGPRGGLPKTVYVDGCETEIIYKFNQASVEYLNTCREVFFVAKTRFLINTLTRAPTLELDVYFV